MAGIYIHIPFCRKACHYCNFHFSTSLHRKPELLQALEREIDTQQFPFDVIPERNIETIYFGGGTPSLLTNDEIANLLSSIKQRFNIRADAEITLEANPDDINAGKLEAWKMAGINRLSIGIQSFFDEDLQWMNRAHNAGQARSCISLAKEYGFNDLTIDLIYGTPTLTDEQWKINVSTALELGVNHISCYALTVEDNTALHHFIKKGKLQAIDDIKQSRHFELLLQWMDEAGFEQYEISNFSKPGHRSRHNSNYWSGNAYYGFGPAAHSFDGKQTRWWNIANNAIYTDKINEGETVFEAEILTPVQRINEQIMTSLRTSDGLNLAEFNNRISNIEESADISISFYNQLRRYEAEDLLQIENGIAKLTQKGKLFADGIASKLFIG